jgi:glycosyltransferase involved in cell wall biosynthesis
MKILTASPIPLTQGSFHRGSYLVSKGLLAAGHESECVRLAPEFEDPAGITRFADRHDFESASFWRSQSADAVYLIAWGDPKFEPIARAIQKAGLHLLEVMDSDGIVSPSAGFFSFLKHSFFAFRSRRLSSFYSAFAALAKTLLHAKYGAFDARFNSHLEHVNHICCESPQALINVKRVFLKRHRLDLAAKLTLLPHPVEEYFNYDNRSKENLVMCSGRYNSYQKDPQLTAASLVLFLQQRKEYSAIVAGPTEGEFDSVLAAAPHGVTARIELLGSVENHKLPGLFAKTKIFHLPSRWEGCPLAAEEALCSGASVVGISDVPAMHYLVGENAGSLVHRRAPGAVASALVLEAAAWDAKKRNPVAISAYAKKRFSLSSVIKRIVDLVSS